MPNITAKETVSIGKMKVQTTTNNYSTDATKQLSFFLKTWLFKFSKYFTSKNINRFLKHWLIFSLSEYGNCEE